MTVFVRGLRRGPLAGTPGIEEAQFQLRDGTWAYLGGGASGPFDDYPLSDRPPAASQQGYLRAHGFGQVSLKGARRFPGPTAMRSTPRCGPALRFTSFRPAPGC